MTESTGNQPTEPISPQGPQTPPDAPLPTPPLPQSPASEQAPVEHPTTQLPPYGPPGPEQPAYSQPTYGQSGYEAPSYPQASYPTDPYGTDTLTVAPPLYTGAVPPVGDAPAGEPATQDGRRRPGRTVALVLATALVAGAVGGGVGAAVAKHSDDASTVTSLTPSSSGQQATVTLPTGTVEAAAAKVLPSVVVITERGTDGSGGEGSGIILSADGLILTNNHVVAESVNGGSLQVTLPGDRTVDATIVGRDPSSDLAVVKVKGVSGLTPATLGSSGSLVVGETVVAVGSPLGLSGTVTSGIVSALDRPVTTGDSGGGQNPFGGSQTAQSTAVLDAIQTDAAINPGNSGGPLVDLAGRVVGINSAIASLGASAGSSQSGSIGLGFAIPIDQAKRIAQELIDKGTATHPQLGVQVTDATNGNGALLRTVTPGGPADKAGLKAGDVVTSVDGKAVTGADDLIAHVRSSAPGATVKVTYVRDGKTATVDVTLGETSS